MEKVKKEWRPGFLDDRPKTFEEQLAIAEGFVEYIKKEATKEKVKEPLNK